MDESRGGIEADRQPLLAGRETEPETNVRLAGAAVADRDDVLPAGTYSERASSSTRVLLSDGMAAKSKLSRLFTAGNRASLIRRSTMRRSRSISSSSAKRSKKRI